VSKAGFNNFIADILEVLPSVIAQSARDQVASPVHLASHTSQILLPSLQHKPLSTALPYCLLGPIPQATGAQLAIEYGKAYPKNTRGLILDNAAWFYDSERDAIMESYFPDISPQEDGSHLQLVWKMATQVYRYFPWYDRSSPVKNSVKIPLSVVQQTALDYLTAGTEYDRAYRAAFLNERPEQLRGLSIPTRLMRWQDSMLKDYTDRLDGADLPANIKMCPAGAGKDNRLSTLEQVLAELL
jgi:hypothetical protein